MMLDHSGEEREADVDVAYTPIAASCTRSVGERLGYLRRRAGLSLTRAAEISGVSKSELSRLENGARQLKLHHKTRLAAAYGVAPHVFEQVVCYDPLESATPVPICLPCYRASMLESKGPARAEESTLVRLSFAIPVSTGAYGIIADAGEMCGLPDRTLAVVDPRARAVLGDLVANIVTWTPVLMILKRDEMGNIPGLGEQAHAKDFHKVVAVLSMSHLGVAS